MRILGLIIFCCLCNVSLSQITSTVTLSADSIGIGDNVDIIYKMSSTEDPAAFDYVIPSFDTLSNLVGNLAQIDTSRVINEYGDFEIIDLGQWEMESDSRIDPVSIRWTQNGNTWIHENTLSLVPWYSGAYQIDPVAIYINDSTQITQTNPSFLLVELIAPAVDSSGQLVIQPVKPIIREEKNWEDYILWFIIVGILVLAFPAYLLIKIIFKKEDVLYKVHKAPPPKPAHVIAEEKLLQLEQEKLWLQNDIKTYQSKLTYIIREYLENRYSIQALKSTTDEIKRALKKHDFDAKYEIKLTEILQIADLVKFAKANPPENIHARFLEDAKEFVTNTKQVDEPHDNSNLNQA